VTFSFPRRAGGICRHPGRHEPGAASSPLAPALSYARTYKTEGRCRTASLESSGTRGCLRLSDAVNDDDDGAVLWSKSIRSDRGDDCEGGDGWELPLRGRVTSGGGGGGGGSWHGDWGRGEDTVT
jgi:hypothetical protein